MFALEHIKAYLQQHFANHDIETLMTHLEAAIEAKVEEAVADVRAEIQALRDELTGGRPSPSAVTIPASGNYEPQPGGMTIIDDPEHTTVTSLGSAQ